MQGGMMGMGPGNMMGGGMMSMGRGNMAGGGMQGGMMSMGGGNAGGMSNPFASAAAAPGFGVTPLPRGLGNDAPALGPKPGAASAAQVFFPV